MPQIYTGDDSFITIAEENYIVKAVVTHANFAVLQTYKKKQMHVNTGKVLKHMAKP